MEAAGAAAAERAADEGGELAAELARVLEDARDDEAHARRDHGPGVQLSLPPARVPVVSTSSRRAAGVTPSRSRRFDGPTLWAIVFVVAGLGCLWHASGLPHFGYKKVFWGSTGIAFLMAAVSVLFASLSSESSCASRPNYASGTTTRRGRAGGDPERSGAIRSEAAPVIAARRRGRLETPGAACAVPVEMAGSDQR